jgi:hypothetical protein
MSDDIFISYSRKDQEFVRRLASDLNEKVAGVWFDQSDIQAGQRWRDEIEQGIRGCKVVILVLSPDSAASRYVQMEINLALEKRKRILPILYRPVKLAGSLKDLVDETQFIDLRRGSYADNFQTLVGGLVDAGAVRQTGAQTPRSFLRKATPTNWGAVIGKIPGWGLAWGLGWAVFGIALLILIGLLNKDQPFHFISVFVYPICGLFGGLVGGLVAGFITMLALRRFAPSINWRHMSPAVWIWAICGPLGLGLSIGLMLLTFKAPGSPSTDCGLNLGCIIGTSVAQAIAIVIGQILLVLFFVVIIWFLTGMLSGWLAVRAIRRLEPGVTGGQSAWVMFGWGLGALAGGFGTVIVVALLSQALGLT